MSDFERIYKDGMPREKINGIEKEYEVIHQSIIDLLESLPEKIEVTKIETTVKDATPSSKRAIKKSVRRQYKI